MGRKRIEQPCIESLYSTISSILVPDYILKDFDIYGAQESKTCWVIDMREKECHVPSCLQSYSDVVFDGYCNPVETGEIFNGTYFPIFHYISPKSQNNAIM